MLLLLEDLSILFAPYTLGLLLVLAVSIQTPLLRLQALLSQQLLALMAIFLLMDIK